MGRPQQGEAIAGIQTPFAEVYADRFEGCRVGGRRQPIEKGPVAGGEAGVAFKSAIVDLQKYVPVTGSEATAVSPIRNTGIAGSFDAIRSSPSRAPGAVASMRTKNNCSALGASVSGRPGNSRTD
jgi:hypothetical protein